jgi:hypothetical protein
MRYDNEKDANRFELFKAGIKIAVNELLGGKTPELDSGDEPELTEDDIL